MSFGGLERPVTAKRTMAFIIPDEPPPKPTMFALLSTLQIKMTMIESILLALSGILVLVQIWILVDVVQRRKYLEK